MNLHRHLLRGIRQKLIVAFSLLVACIAALVFIFLPSRLERQAMAGLEAFHGVGENTRSD